MTESPREKFKRLFKELGPKEVRKLTAIPEAFSEMDQGAKQ